MVLFLFFLTASFIGGLVLWNRKPQWQNMLLLALILLLSIAYLVFGKL